MVPGSPRRALRCGPEHDAGSLAIPGFEHVAFEAKVTEIDPEHFFAFTWHPYPRRAATSTIRPRSRPSSSSALEPTAAGTRVTVSESGFERLPEHRRAEAFRMNDGGWSAPAGEHPRLCCRRSETAERRDGLRRARRPDAARPRRDAAPTAGRGRCPSSATARRSRRQAVTKHLHVLEAAGVVGSLRAGRETRFALAPTGSPRRATISKTSAASGRPPSAASRTSSKVSRRRGRQGNRPMRPARPLAFCRELGPGSRPAKPRPKAVQP